MRIAGASPGGNIFRVPDNSDQSELVMASAEGAVPLVERFDLTVVLDVAQGGLQLDWRLTEQHSLPPSKPQLNTGMNPPAGLPRVKYLPCPRCRQLMNRKNFALRSGIIVDVCAEHGTWFDANELHHIVQFIRQGGMTTAREFEKQDLERARRMATLRQPTQTVHSGSGPVAPEWGGSLLASLLEIAVKVITKG